MKGQAIWLLRPGAALSGAQILDDLDRLDVRKTEPISGEFRAWGTTVETAGRSWSTTPEVLFGHLLKTREEIAFQLWLGPGATLVSAQYLSDLLAITFRLDGRTRAEAEALVARTFWTALNHEQSIGFLVDLTLPESRDEWGSFLRGDVTIVPATGTLAWLRGDGKSSFLRVHPSLWDSSN